MKRRLALVVLVALCCCMLFVFAAPAAFADMGPKPAVTIKFRNMGEEKMCVTLLSKYKDSGPAQIYDPTDEYRNDKNVNWITSDGRSHYYSESDGSSYGDTDFSADVQASWQAFWDYSQQDGYYFLQHWWEFADGQPTSFTWSYYAPKNFKLLIYYPETETFACSDVCVDYAYHSYYTVDLSRTDGMLKLADNYDYFGEILGLAVRIAATVLVELVVALIFRLNSYRQIKTVIFANIATQTLLNVGLNILAYFNTSFIWLFVFIPMELAVFAAEATAYGIVWRKDRVPVWKSVVYALTANVVSAVLGIGLAWLCPLLF